MTTKRLLTSALVLACLAGAIATAAARERPTVTGFTFSPSTFAVTKSPSTSASAVGRGTRIRFHLSERAGRIRITVARGLTSRKVGGRCVKSTSRLRKRRGCTRYVSVGTITRRNVGARDGRLSFSGRFEGRELAPGRYRATIVAVDRGHRRSKQKTTTFMVVRARSTSGSPSTPPAPAPPSTPPSPPPPDGFPNASDTGVPAGWTPKHTTNGDLTITVPGTVLDGELVTGNLYVHTRNVTIRNSWIYGSINNQLFSGDVGIDYGGMLIEDTDVGPRSGTGGAPFPAILVAGYTARRVHIHNTAEGFRVADFNNPAIPDADETVVIEDSYVHIERGDCFHNDGIQGYGEPARTIINHNTIDTTASGPDCTTGAIFIGNDNPDLITVTNNMLLGGGFTMRIGGPGPDGPGGTYDHVSANRIITNSWGYGPVIVDDCRTVADWSDNRVVTIDANYQVTSILRTLNTC